MLNRKLFILIAALTMLAALLSPAFHNPTSLAQDGDDMVRGMEINEARDCTNGLLLNISVDETVGSDEAVFIGWAYAHPVYGLGANGLLMTIEDIQDEDIVVAHPGLPEDTATTFFTTVVTEELVELLRETDIPTLLAAINDPNTLSPQLALVLLEIVDQIQTTPSATAGLSIQDCELDQEPTTSTLEADDEAITSFLEDIGLFDVDMDTDLNE